MKPSLPLSDIRNRLNMAFDESELRGFCLDYFGPVYERFAQGMEKDEKISLLLNYCRRDTSRIHHLLEALEQEIELEPHQEILLRPIIKRLDAYLKDLASSEEPTLDDRQARQALTAPTEASYQPEQLDQAIADSAKHLASQTAAAVAPSPPRPLSPSKKPLGIGSERVCPKDGMVQVYVPAGKFLMGSSDDDPLASHDEKPQHEVYLDAYWIDKTPVTNTMFTKFVQETGYVTEAEKAKYKNAWRSKAGKGRETHPVVYVSWNDVVVYAKWAERRLPTEAEWEKAAGGTNERKYPWGNEQPTDKLCNFNMNVGDTTPVDNYPDGASPYGALDMAGNVWEWCNDNWDSSFYASSFKTNPQGPNTKGAKVLRGGSWNNSARVARARNRNGVGASYRDRDGGFRCAQSHS